MSTVRRLKIAVLIILVVSMILSLIFAAGSIGYVGVSEVAIIIDPLAGQIVGTVEGPRYFFKLPWQTYVTISLSVTSLDMWTDWRTGKTGEWPAITCLTKDGLEVHVDITVRWRVDPNRIVDLYRNYPSLDWETKTMAPLLRETVRNTIAKYTAIETIEKRAEISSIIVSEFKKAINEEKSLAGAIIIEGIDLRNIELPTEFKRAVEQKLAEEQQKIAAQFRRERMLIEANATAEAAILKALGEAKAKLIAANATAEALKLVLLAAGSANSTEVAIAYLNLLMLRELVKEGGSIYVIVVTGSGGQGAQVIPIPITPTTARYPSRSSTP